MARKVCCDQSCSNDLLLILYVYMTFISHAKRIAIIVCIFFQVKEIPHSNRFEPHWIRFQQTGSYRGLGIDY